MFIFTRCRVSFAVCSMLVIFVKPENGSDIHLILTRECQPCAAMLSRGATLVSL